MEFYGDIQIPLPEESDGAKGKSLDLKTLLESILNNSEPRYINFRSLLASAPELKSVLDHSALRNLAGLPDRSPFMSKPFIGQKNCRSIFHNDNGHNFLTNFCGERTMILFSLSETPFLYPRAECPLPGTYSFRTRCSENFIFDSKFEEFPLTRFAQRMEGQLFPGNIFFLSLFSFN